MSVGDHRHAMHENVRHLTQNERNTIEGAIATVEQYLLPATQDRFYELLQREGWVIECEDCEDSLQISEQGNPCGSCGHVQGDPRTGAPAEGQVMRVCEACMANEHEHCDAAADAGHALPLENVPPPYCNCQRLDHPPVTVHQEDPLG